MSFPAYPRYKASGVEWLGQVPDHWSVTRFKWHISRNDGGAWGEDPDGISDTVVLRSTEQTVDGFWQIENPAVRKLSDDEKCTTLLEEGDLLVTKSSGSSLHIGKTTIVDREVAALRCCYSNFMQRVRTRDSLLPKLAWYVMNGEIVRRQFDLQSNSTTGLANLNGTMIGELIISVPKPDEQLNIVSFLDRETTKIDALVEEQQRLIDLLKEKRHAFITQAVTKGLDTSVPMKPSGIEWLGDVPAHWDVSTVGYRYDVQLGKMLDTARVTGEHLRPYLRVYDVQWRSINTDDLPTMDFGEEARVRFRLEKGDLLVNEGGSYVGRSAIWQGELVECYYQKALHRLRPRDPSRDTTKFMLNVMEFATKYGVFVAGGNQTTIDHLTADQFRRYRFAYPPLEEQLEISAYLDERLSSFDLLTSEAQNAITLLQERRSALISATVTGKIDVRHLFPQKTKAA